MPDDRKSSPLPQQPQQQHPTDDESNPAYTPGQVPPPKAPTPRSGHSGDGGGLPPRQKG